MLSLDEAKNALS